MRALFVMDPLSTVHPDKDSSYALMLEWQDRGHEVWICGPEDLHAEGDEILADAQRLRVGPRPKIADVLERRDLRCTEELDLCFQRKDPPFHMGYIFCTYLLDVIHRKLPVINAPAGLRDANEKMIILAFPDLIPATIVTRDQGRIRSFLKEQGGRAIIKPWDGNGGRGIFVLREGDGNLGSILETSTANGRDHVMVQSYVPEIKAGDKRIILVDGEPKGAFLRVPPADDHRGNMHVGARVEPTELNEDDLRICTRLQPFLVQSDLLFTGIDVIGRYLTEVNVTSPTGLQECAELYGTRIEVDIIDAALRRRAQRREAP